MPKSHRERMSGLDPVPMALGSGATQVRSAPATFAAGALSAREQRLPLRHDLRRGGSPHRRGRRVELPPTSRHRHQRNGAPEGAPSACGVGSSDQFGSTTVSITWITPLLAAMSVLITLALLTVTPAGEATTFSGAPCTVLTAPVFTSAAMTLPPTT